MPVLLFFAFCFAMLYYTMRPRPTTLKSTSDMEGMREAGRMAALVLEHLSPLVVPNVTTEVLDEAAARYTSDLGCISAPLNYGGIAGRFLAAAEVTKALCVLVSHAWW